MSKLDIHVTFIIIMKYLLQAKTLSSTFHVPKLWKKIILWSLMRISYVKKVNEIILLTSFFKETVKDFYYWTLQI